jgi:hypothetical protein
VWYIGEKQKGLIDKLAVAQNEGLQKITGTFCTILTEPLHNLMEIPPILYLLCKLMISYSFRLW